MANRIKWWFPLAAAAVLAAAALAGRQADLAAEGAAQPPVLVIDAGHGGADGGAVAADGTLESEINLDIALRLEALARFWGLDPVMTRREESIGYPAGADTIAKKKVADQHARLALINGTPGAVLVSIHQNNYPAAAPRGIQVFYNASPGADAFAALAQENLTACLLPENRRVAAPADPGVFLMKRTACPAILAECGFLSNPGDLAKLRTPEYRTQLAVVLLGSYLQYIRGTIA